MDQLFKKITRPFNGTWDAIESNRAVLEDILLRLPVKSLLAFKSISKLWHGVISTNDFMILHRSFSINHPKYFIFCDIDKMEDGKVREMYQMEPNGFFSASYSIPNFESINNPLLISSFNGLICYLNQIEGSSELYDVDLRICNPATREVLLLPRGQSSVYMPSYGLVYSNNFHFYKIYNLFGEVAHEYCQCEVFSSRTGAWKQLGDVDICPLMNSHVSYAPPVCINEKLYCLLADKNTLATPSSILMVDMDDNFKEIKLPIEACFSFLIELSGQLCFIEWTGYRMVIFVYEEEKDGWHLVDMPLFPDKYAAIDHFDCVTSFGNQILFVYSDALDFRHQVLYELCLRRWKDFHIPEGSQKRPLAVFPFFETLLPCVGSDLQLVSPQLHPGHGFDG